MKPQLALGLKEAAEAVGLSHWTLRQYIKEGRIASIKLGRRVLIEPKELERLVEQGRSGTSDRHRGQTDNLHLS